MRITKYKLADLEQVYAASSITVGEQVHLCAAAEGHGPCLLFTPPKWRSRVLAVEPGGTVCLVPIPGRQGQLLAAMQCYPVFQGEAAGVFLLEAHKHEPAAEALRLFDLPFVHRIEIIHIAGTPMIVAATLCSGKRHRDDWSQPGAIHLGHIPEQFTSRWQSSTLLSISKNHGLHLTPCETGVAVLVAGAEGLFELRAPLQPNGAWKTQHILKHEVSDVYACDLDGDGYSELVTIEPFHGNALRIYAKRNLQWQCVYEAEIDLGHALWAGRLGEIPTVIVGNRAGLKEIVLYSLRPAAKYGAQRIVLDAGVGSSQITVIRTPQADLLLSANHAAGEVALYEISHANDGVTRIANSVVELST